MWCNLPGKGKKSFKKALLWAHLKKNIIISGFFSRKNVKIQFIELNFIF